jgi:hypothetical protein
MSKYVVGSKILKKEQVLISIFAMALLLLSSASLVAVADNGHDSTHIVKPNGVDDTANIQAALNACTAGNQGGHDDGGEDNGCTVQLLAGTYYVSQIAVTGFQGSFVGAGQGVTIIQALPACSTVLTTHCLQSPNPADNTDTTPFWAAPPTPVTGSNPWPVLFTFVNAQLVMSRMSINEPYATPTPGWDNEVRTPYTGEPSWVTALEGEVLITGQTQSVTIDHLTLTGSVGDYEGYNTEGLVNDWGYLLPTGWTPPPSPTTPPTALTDQIPLSGTFTLSNSLIIGNNPIIDDVRNAVVTISHDMIQDNGPALAELVVVFDVSNSKIVITQNLGISQSVYQAVFEWQSWAKPACTATITSNCLLPSTLYVTDNSFHLNQGANAVWAQDSGEAFFGTPVTLSAVVSGNVFQNSYAGGDGWYYSVVVGITLKSTIVSSNYISGGGSPGAYINGGPGTVSLNTITGADTGVWLDSASGVYVAGNIIRNSVEYGIALTSTNVAGSSAPLLSNNNKITGDLVHGSGTDDLYWDGLGTGNVWFGNICHTSSPTGLC